MRHEQAIPVQEMSRRQQSKRTVVAEISNSIVATLRVEPLAVVVLAFSSCYLCAALTHFMGLPATPSSAVIGVGVTTIAIGLRLPGFVSLAAFAGSFGGMAALPADGAWPLSATLLATAVAISVWAFHVSPAINPMVALPGVGGRLGVFAFVGFLLFNTLFQQRLPVYHAASLTVVGLAKSAAWIFIGASLTAMLRNLLSKESPHSNVLASSAIGLVGALPLICHIEEIGGFDVGQSVATTIYLGTFIGMSELTLLRSSNLIIGSLISSVLLGLAGSWLAGWGGLLGTVSACSVVLTRVLDRPASPDFKFGRHAIGFMVSILLVGSFLAALSLTETTEFSRSELPKALKSTTFQISEPAREIVSNGETTEHFREVMNALTSENKRLVAKPESRVAENEAVKTELSELRARLASVEQAHERLGTALVGNPGSNDRCSSASRDALLSLSLPFQRYQESLNFDHVEQLARIIALSQECQNMRITVSGFTDSRGGELTNKSLSWRRAELVAEYLRMHKVDMTLISTAGFGSSHPIDSNASDEGRARNRRVEVSAHLDQPALRNQGLLDLGSPRYWSEYECSVLRRWPV